MKRRFYYYVFIIISCSYKCLSNFQQYFSYLFVVENGEPWENPSFIIDVLCYIKLSWTPLYRWESNGNWLQTCMYVPFM